MAKTNTAAGEVPLLDVVHVLRQVNVIEWPLETINRSPGIAEAQFRFPGWWAKLSTMDEQSGSPSGLLAPGTAGSMTMAGQISTIARLFAPLIVGAGLIGSAHAQDCPRGDLDKAYCDRDGDLVADDVPLSSDESLDVLLCQLDLRYRDPSRCAGRQASEKNGHSRNGETKHLVHGRAPHIAQSCGSTSSRATLQEECVSLSAALPLLR
jgi:hypothetical protein